MYANGKELEPARRVTLTHSMLRNWEAILAQVTEKVNLTSGAARKWVLPPFLSLNMHQADVRTHKKYTIKPILLIFISEIALSQWSRGNDSAVIAKKVVCSAQHLVYIYMYISLD